MTKYYLTNQESALSKAATRILRLPAIKYMEVLMNEEDIATYNLVYVYFKEYVELIEELAKDAREHLIPLDRIRNVALFDEFKKYCDSKGEKLLSGADVPRNIKEKIFKCTTSYKEKLELYDEAIEYHHERIEKD